MAYIQIVISEPTTLPEITTYYPATEYLLPSCFKMQSSFPYLDPNNLNSLFFQQR
jgi:hypothetical protein